ncbi:MAG: CbtB-domain containing protein [Sphingobium sp.]
MATTAALFDDGFIPVRGGTAIPIEDILPWAVFGALIALIFLYFVSTEQGAFAIFDGMYVHEFVHDGRHLLGFPCH